MVNTKGGSNRRVSVGIVLVHHFVGLQQDLQLLSLCESHLFPLQSSDTSLDSVSCCCWRFLRTIFHSYWASPKRSETCASQDPYESQRCYCYKPERCTTIPKLVWNITFRSCILDKCLAQVTKLIRIMLGDDDCLLLLALGLGWLSSPAVV
jgi:hypothetical protein